MCWEGHACLQCQSTSVLEHCKACKEKNKNCSQVVVAEFDTDSRKTEQIFSSVTSVWCGSDSYSTTADLRAHLFVGLPILNENNTEAMLGKLIWDRDNNKEIYCNLMIIYMNYKQHRLNW